MQASAGIGYANVKMMQYDVSNYGEKRMMDVAEMVRYSCFCWIAS